MTSTCTNFTHPDKGHTWFPALHIPTAILARTSVHSSHEQYSLVARYIYYLVEGAQRGRKPRPFALHDAPDLIMPPDDEEEEEEGGAAATAAADCEKPIRSEPHCFVRLFTPGLCVAVQCRYSRR